ncbi:O-antigen ligase family protein [Oscillatoria sp. FACHB-1407]|uniref:O-antigen ligase family protein n=1 Tax=Oscillatoria sp. FACHB-1407 TaxID=2692847 RepID=UPI0016827EC6|nr:O-antigen ligase family protein [Oscillatoria sp. FACHB-1407]MBD2459692.1 O-antigen ligase family protein [Oscillatoria sp. FACHB-1407]
MKLNQLRSLTTTLEPYLVSFLILYFLGLDLPFPSIFNAATYGIITILIAPHWKRTAYVIAQQPLLILLHVITVMSVLWSVAPEFTADETKAVVRAALFGIYLAVRFSLQDQMYLLARTLAVSLVFSLLVGFALPGYGIHTTGEFAGSWKGVFLFKNLFAYIVTLAAISFVLIGLFGRKYRLLTGFMLGIAVLLLILSRGRTALAVFIISLCLLPVYGVVKQKFRIRVVLITFGILLTGITIALLLGNLEFIVVDLLGKNLEFNGRLPIWQLMLEKASERPWLGYGYSGFWTSDESIYILLNTWAQEAHDEGLRFNAHNGYLELFLQLGWVGLGIYLISFINLMCKTIYLVFRTKSLEIFWVLQLLVAMFIFNFTDSLGILATGAQWSIYISFVSSITMQYKRIKRNDNLKASETNQYPFVPDSSPLIPNH